MYLKRLELLGFKSFATRTVLELDRGITALVGPNGSGKSNVADAVRWALGEQSLRAVRGRKSEDVIFAGNARRPAVGMAEVTVVLDNSDGALQIPFAEVSITRRQYRLGEGEYLINRARARLRDVVDLLSGIGLGPDSYAVVGQGAVDEMLMQRGEERRALLEMAADISRHQIRLRESLDRLAETEANLLRAEDIRGEIAPRISKLRAQASRARRHQELSGKLKQMVHWRCLLMVRQTRRRCAVELEMERSRAERTRETGRARDLAREQAAGLKTRLCQEETSLEAGRQRLNDLRLAQARIEREAALAREREAALRRQLGEAEEELAATREERRGLDAEIQKMAALQSDLEAREERVRSAMVPVETERRQALSQQRLLQAQLERTSGELQVAARRRSELEARRGALARELRAADGVRAEAAEIAGQATDRLAGLQQQLAIAHQELERLREEQATAEARGREARDRLRAQSQQMDAARRLEREAWERESDLRNRCSLLRSLKEEHRGLPGGAKTILDAHLPGIRGTLASMVRVPLEYVTSVAAALGGAQGYVVSEGLREGLEALRFLSEHSGRATIAPLRLEKSASQQTPSEEFRAGLAGVLEGIAFRGLAADLVSCPPEARELCARYLGLSLVVEEMADAVELHRRLTELGAGRLPFQVVTMDGRVLRARGDLASARNGEKDGGLLAREAELRRLAEEAEEAAAKLKAAGAAVAALESIRAELARASADAAAETARLQSQMAKQSSACAALATQAAREESAIEWHRSRAAAAEREDAQSRDAAARTERELAETVLREKEARDRLEQLRGDLEEHQSAVAGVSARLSRLQSEAGEVRNRLRELDARVSTLSEAIQRADLRVGRQTEKLSQLSQGLEQLSRGPGSALPAASAEELEATERLVAEGMARVAEGRDRCAAAEADLAALSQAHETAREELSEARSKAQRAVAELAALLRESAREAELDLEWAESETPEALVERAEQVVERLGELLGEAPLDEFPATAAAATERVEKLRRELQSLGTINAEAPEEYRLVSERHGFLTAQMDDLRRAERTLRKAIDELREVMGARFQRAFDQVNAEFGRCFAALFGGGSAGLVLSRPDQPLEGRVEVVAAPPGRRGGSLLGFSGGERALTSIALLFALMRVNPSPFCLLDEVDAALDETNVHRFCGMVRGLAGSTQFLLVTHNRVTMEMADALYGVSMSPDSISGLMSLRLASNETRG